MHWFPSFLSQLLKKDLSESEQKVRELMDLRREEQVSKSAVHVTKSVEATRAHLQGQLHNKEAENNRLAVQLRVHTPLSTRCSVD
uniref:Uncharacterized protein n=1 Tax=Amphilophus citrinellus TaxID=61819 RepID=A0A3Q0STK5_AMPCI